MRDDEKALTCDGRRKSTPKGGHRELDSRASGGRCAALQLGSFTGKQKKNSTLALLIVKKFRVPTTALTRRGSVLVADWGPLFEALSWLFRSERGRQPEGSLVTRLLAHEVLVNWLLTSTSCAGSCTRAPGSMVHRATVSLTNLHSAVQGVLSPLSHWASRHCPAMRQYRFSRLHNSSLIILRTKLNHAAPLLCEDNHKLAPLITNYDSSCR